MLALLVNPQACDAVSCLCGIAVNEEQGSVIGFFAIQELLCKQRTHLPSSDDRNGNLVRIHVALFPVLVQLAVNEARGQRQERHEAGNNREVPNTRIQIECLVKQARHNQTENATASVGNDHFHIHGGVGISPHVRIDTEDKSHQHQGGKQDRRCGKEILGLVGLMRVYVLGCPEVECVGNYKAEHVKQDQNQFSKTWKSENLGVHNKTFLSNQTPLYKRKEANCDQANIISSTGKEYLS